MAAAMAAECVVLVVVRTVVVVCVVVCEQHLVCELGGQVSEARVVRTFLANDAAYLTLLGAVTQLRRSEIVSLGVGLPVVVLCGVFNESWVSADCPFLRIKTQHIIRVHSVCTGIGYGRNGRLARCSMACPSTLGTNSFLAAVGKCGSPAWAFA